MYVCFPQLILQDFLVLIIPLVDNEFSGYPAGCEESLGSDMQISIVYTAIVEIVLQ
ncbi:hypothetical protein O6H91_12G085400 [Diphasiastrum complanatum]|uniref:Uncharacterized protein n=4 Tax=Diphasiastrum complanatum TaxID=34168 RepID=A0ACC2C4J0_DIPCM|nr:hypothetical protein O6H91_12G085100 [Diphasiastrum complanatum]KAJ7536858.1 hypothetical protein O6H91_12G085200 [Diphasiastrum complanatum]KAJ7536859.1 hypothetical protein O6H91_12G085300 [Diphasiastrum complanatum]KAJ7536860.1 hypothetical protein O6H91_12G085400 [Diphasiastrum complanatum]